MNEYTEYDVEIVAERLYRMLESLKREVRELRSLLLELTEQMYTIVESSESHKRV